MLTEKMLIFVQYTDLLRRFLRVPDKHVDRIEHAVAKGGPHLNYTCCWALVLIGS